MSQPTALALDVGGTKIEICTVDAENTVLSSRRIETHALRTGEVAFIDDLKALIQRELTGSITRLGIAFNCVVDRGVIVASSLLGGLDINYPLVEEFQREFGVEVRLENDVNAHALAESRLGKGQGVHSFVFLNLGTGLASAYIEEGRLLRGYSGVAGEIWQIGMLIPELGRDFRLREVVSGKGISALHKHLSGKDLSAEEIFAAYRRGDEVSARSIDIFTHRLAEVLEMLSCFYNPQIVIVGGGLTKSAQHFLPQAVELYRQRTLPFFHVEEVTISELEHAACLGVVL